MSKIKIFMENKKNKKEYHVDGLYYDGKICGLKGGTINTKNSQAESFKMNKKVEFMRKDNNFVDKNGKILQDIIFDNVTQAAQFVCGYSVSGLLSWHVEKHTNLKKYLGGE